MKKIIGFVVVLSAVCTVSAPAFAQGWVSTMASSGMRAGNGTVGVQSDTENRLSGTTREQTINQALYEDRQKLKQVKRLLKEAKTEEERQELLGLKRDLEHHIVELQQG